MAKTVRLSSKRQIAIPKTLCDKLGIQIGQDLTIAAAHGHLILSPKPKRYWEALEGLGEEIWRGIDPLTYVRKERTAWEKRHLPRS